ncbi:MAG: hypothetical protein EU542_02210 [Promethearchaeota archaeon]|nr:MAG: hypothetical protein EU542_02210 [Candidatus Lokiarchaeota archaeon]
MEEINKEEQDKDKIIEILREEIALIKRMNLEVLNEKDKLIKNLHDVIQDKEDTIKRLRKHLKQESEIDFLVL